MAYKKYRNPPGPIQRRPGRAVVTFPPPEEIRALELAFVAASGQVNTDLDPFDEGLSLARALVLQRAKREYRDDFQITATVLAFKSWNDLLASGLLTRSGYAAQSFPLLRSALENAEVLDFLERNREAVHEYLEGRGRFERSKGLGWLRNYLPQPDTRAQLYDVLNYQTHSNIRGIGVYNYEEFKNELDAEILAIGPMQLRDARLSPQTIFNALVNYPTRVLLRCDPDAPSPELREKFEHWDKGTGRFLEDAVVLDTAD